MKSPEECLYSYISFSMRRIAIFHKRDNSIVRDPLTPFEADDKKDVGISF